MKNPPVAIFYNNFCIFSDENNKQTFRQRKAAQSISTSMNEAFFLEDGHEDGIGNIIKT